eukprot:6213660-Pleurochrysis_carterae.AAC.2
MLRTLYPASLQLAFTGTCRLALLRSTAPFFSSSLKPPRAGKDWSTAAVGSKSRPCLDSAAARFSEKLAVCNDFEGGGDRGAARSQS